MKNFQFVFVSPKDKLRRLRGVLADLKGINGNLKEGSNEEFKIFMRQLVRKTFNAIENRGP